MQKLFFRNLLLSAAALSSTMLFTSSSSAYDWERNDGGEPKIFCTAKLKESVNPRQKSNAYTVTFSADGSTRAERTYSCSIKKDPLYFVPDTGSGSSNMLGCSFAGSSQGSDYTLTGKDYSRSEFGSTVSSAAVCAASYTQLGIQAVKR